MGLVILHHPPPHPSIPSYSSALWSVAVYGRLHFPRSYASWVQTRMCAEGRLEGDREGDAGFQIMVCTKGKLEDDWEKELGALFPLCLSNVFCSSSTPSMLPNPAAVAALVPSATESPSESASFQHPSDPGPKVVSCSCQSPHPFQLHTSALASVTSFLMNPCSKDSHANRHQNYRGHPRGRNSKGESAHLGRSSHSEGMEVLLLLSSLPPGLQSASTPSSHRDMERRCQGSTEESTPFTSSWSVE